MFRNLSYKRWQGQQETLKTPGLNLLSYTLSLAVPPKKSWLRLWYNEYMGCVDEEDQLRGYYHVRMKCTKNYKYVFWFGFDVGVTNTFILYSRRYSVPTGKLLSSESSSHNSSLVTIWAEDVLVDLVNDPAPQTTHLVWSHAYHLTLLTNVVCTVGTSALLQDDENRYGSVVIVMATLHFA